MSDSSALQSTLTTLLQYNYVTVTLLTAVAYDYVLTFSNEVEYIWSKPWTWVSTMFILVRYFGFCNFAISVLVGSTFVPGPAKTYVSVLSLPKTLNATDACYTVVSPLIIFLVYFIHGCFQGEILDIINEWLFILFLFAADVVMILRVWAMYNRSRLILGVLLLLFTLEVISTLLVIGVDSDPNKLVAGTLQILEFSFCVIQVTEPVWTNVAVILQVTQSAVMCLLAVFQVARESFRLYRATKQWKPNRYISLLVKQGIFSFFAVFLFNLINLLFTSTTAPTGWQGILLTILEYVPIYTLTPRFILSIRELYASDVRGREGIDTGFGLSISAATTMAFADAGRHESLEQIEEIPMEQGTSRAV